MTYPPPQPPPYGPGGYHPPSQPYGYGYPGSQFGPPPNNNFVYGIIATVLCCSPLGIVSLVKSSKVGSLWAQGRFEESRKAAASAKAWAIWAGVIWALALVAYVVLFFVFWAAVAESAN